MDFIQELTNLLKQGRDEVMMRGDYGMELFAKRTSSGEMALSVKAAQKWELILLIDANGTVQRQQVLFFCVAETINKMLRDEAEKAAQTPAARETMPVSDEPRTAAQCVAKMTRCAHYKSIKRAYAIARDLGLDTKADAKMRAAFGRFLGCTIESRDLMTPGDWLLVGNAIKARHLAW
jgi:hypothetical protein